MPGRDQSGPQGMGPQTGRGLGNCRGNANNNSIFGRGRGLGFGRRRGFGNAAAFEASPAANNAAEERINALESALQKAIEEIKELKKG